MTPQILAAIVVASIVVWAILSVISSYLEEVAERAQGRINAYPAYGAHRPPQPPPNPRPMVSVVEFRAPEVRRGPVVMHTTNADELEAALRGRTDAILRWARDMTRDLEPKDNQ